MLLGQFTGVKRFFNLKAAVRRYGNSCGLFGYDDAVKHQLCRFFGNPLDDIAAVLVCHNGVCTENHRYGILAQFSVNASLRKGQHRRRGVNRKAELCIFHTGFTALYVILYSCIRREIDYIIPVLEVIQNKFPFLSEIGKAGRCRIGIDAEGVNLALV